MMAYYNKEIDQSDSVQEANFEKQTAHPDAKNFQPEWSNFASDYYYTKVPRAFTSQVSPQQKASIGTKMFADASKCKISQKQENAKRPQKLVKVKWIN